MSAESAFGHVVVPESLPPTVEHKLQRRRRERATDLSNSSAREPRPNLDSLALGAPLTAAFVGVLVAQGEVLAGSGSPAGPDAGWVVRGPAAGSTGDTAPADKMGIASAAVSSQGVLTSNDVAATGMFDPTLTPEPAAPSESEPAGAGPSGGPGVSPAPSDGFTSQATIIAGPQINASLSVITLGSFATGDDMTSPVGGGDPIGVTVPGTDGDDVIHGTDDADHIAGGAGDDVIYGHGGPDVLDGGTGNDQLSGDDGDDLLFGDEGDDRLDGGQGDDHLDGGSGDDSLFGNAGRDTLDGGTGNDLLDGGAGADTMQGAAGNDAFVVDDPNDVPEHELASHSGGGSDTLRVEDGITSGLPSPVDQMTFVFSGSFGATLPGDLATYVREVSPGIENLVLSGTAGHDAIGDDGNNQIAGNAGNNTIYGGGGHDILSGGGGDDILHGGTGIDQLDGGDGNDILSGDGGDDQLSGGAADDVLSGGLGADQLYGQAGNDTFVLGLNDSAVDTVFDHEGLNQITIEGVNGNHVETALSGNDLYVVVDFNPVAMIKDYLGHEGSWSGIDAGSGVTAIQDLMTGNENDQQAAATEFVTSPPAAGPDDDLLGAWLNRPNLQGGAHADILQGGDGPDWLSGLDGDDQLHGGEGRDVLEGGNGSDQLHGAGGDDHYVFTSGETGTDTISDTDGSNTAELHGFTGARLEGVVVGRDLLVVADYAPVFKVENFVGHEQAFAGIQNGDAFVPTGDLFST